MPFLGCVPDERVGDRVFAWGGVLGGFDNLEKFMHCEGVVGGGGQSGCFPDGCLDVFPVLVVGIWCSFCASLCEVLAEALGGGGGVQYGGLGCLFIHNSAEPVPHLFGAALVKLGTPGEP